MTVYLHAYMQCDLCHWAKIEGDSAKDVRAEAKALGWKKIGGRDVCKQCFDSAPSSRPEPAR